MQGSGRWMAFLPFSYPLPSHPVTIWLFAPRGPFGSLPANNRKTAYFQAVFRVFLVHARGLEPRTR